MNYTFQIRHRCKGVILSRTRYHAAQSHDEQESTYVIVVDNVASRENVTRYAQHQGYQVSVAEEKGEFTLSITR